MKIKRAVSLILSVIFLISAFTFGTTAVEGEDNKFDLKCRSAILMEEKTGKILYQMNADEPLPPASVTKVMTLLLIMEAIDSGKISFSDTVTASAHACSMGGSQIYLKEGEKMTVEDLVKSVTVASANDAAVALAEYVAGTEEAFVKMMNDRAKSLCLEGTHFENTNGLDDTVENHVSTAKDIAIMSRELIKHEKILEFSSIWMDTVRNGEFGLTNTNRLIRFYKGATGLKTGSTAKAKFCVTATAKRGDMSLICVIMAAPTRDIRNAEACSLLDYGFANYGMYKNPAKELDPMKVLCGKSTALKISYSDFYGVFEKGDISRVEYEVDLPKNVIAPVKKGDVIGKVIYKLDGKEIASQNIVSCESVERINFFGILINMLCRIAMC